MPDLYLILDLIVVVALTILAVTVLIKDQTKILNRSFACFVACIVVWIMANYVSNDTALAPRTALIANYFVFAFSFGAGVFLLQFVSHLSNDHKAQKWLRRAYLPLSLVALLGATPLVPADVKLQDKVYAVIFGPAAPLYFIVLIAVIGMSVYLTRRNIKHAKGSQKARLRVLFLSLCWTFPVLILAQAVLPATTGWFGLTNIGVMPMLILVYGLYYGVVKHRLFDLKLIIVRALAYVLTLGLIALVFGASSYYVTTAITDSRGPVLGRVLNILLISVVVLLYTPTKQLFDKVTNRFFYQDAYDSQDLFDQLNRNLVSSLDVQPITHNSAVIIAQHLKPEYCMIGLYGDSLRLYGDQRPSVDHNDLLELSRLTSNSSKVVFVTDDLEQSRNKELYQLLQKTNAALLIKLTPNVKNKSGLGFMLLGNKRSGSPYSSQDVRVLDTAAKEIIIALQNAFHYEEIQRFNQTLQQKVEDATKQLRETNKKLKQLNESKDDFIGMASHQLRTPLTSVKGYISLVVDGDAGKINKDQQKLLQQAFFSAQKMVFLVADLLNVSRLKTGKFVIERAPVSLDKMISEEMNQLKQEAAGRGLELSYTAPKDFPALPLDETKTRQVLMNFMDNAIYYTPSGGHIKVELTDLPKSVEFRVVDDGIGVPKQERHHLFTKFYRAKNAQRARPDGTGLGLYMAQKVVTAQGGAIIFSSEEGKGSTFGFTFPKDMPDGMVALPPQTRD